MIHLSRLKKVNENVLIDYPNQFEKVFENLDTKEGTLICCHQSQGNNLTWLVYRKNDHKIRIEVRDEKNVQYSYLDLEDCFVGSEVTFKGFSDNRIIVSLTAGQDGSQDFCLEFLNHELSVRHQFPRDLAYVFTIDEESSLLVNFYTTEFYKISNHDFQIKSSQRFPVFEQDGLSNVWKINNSYGVLSTTEERWFVFHLKTLELVDEMMLDKCRGENSGVDTLFQTSNQLIFRRYRYNEGTKEVEYISVEKNDLETCLNNHAKESLGGLSMVILELYQGDYQKDLVAFDSLEEGKAFVAQIPGYTLENEDGFEVEYVNPKHLSDYMEIVFNGNIVPLSRFSFDPEENVEIIWKEISNLSVKNDKVVEGATKIDAYVVNNDEVKAYVEAREANFRKAKAFLENKGYEVDRSYFGSEDGEAILYRKHGTEDWHFLCHLDPLFVEIEDVEEYVKEEIQSFS